MYLETWLYGKERLKREFVMQAPGGMTEQRATQRERDGGGWRGGGRGSVSLKHKFYAFSTKNSSYFGILKMN